MQPFKVRINHFNAIGMPLHKMGSPILANTLIWKFLFKASISNEIDMLPSVAMVLRPTKLTISQGKSTASSSMFMTHLKCYWASRPVQLWWTHGLMVHHPLKPSGQCCWCSCSSGEEHFCGNKTIPPPNIKNWQLHHVSISSSISGGKCYQSSTKPA